MPSCLTSQHPPPRCLPPASQHFGLNVLAIVLHETRGRTKFNRICNPIAYTARGVVARGGVRAGEIIMFKEKKMPALQWAQGVLADERFREPMVVPPHLMVVPPLKFLEYFYM